MGYEKKKNEGILTGKIFEYLATNCPILAIGPKNSELNEILTVNKCGTLFPFHENPLGYIQEIYQEWKSEKGSIITTNQTRDINAFSRKVLTEKLSSIFNSFVAG